MLNSIIFILVVTVIFILIVIFEMRLEVNEFYYNCYKRMQFKYPLSNYKCMGVNRNECKECPYYKRYLKNKGK